MNQLLHSIKLFFKFRNRGGTVRYMFSAVLSFAVLLGAAVITSNDSSYIRLQSSAATIEQGKPFYVDVFAYAHVPVNAVDITINFDQEAVSVTGVDTGQSVLTIWTEEPIIESKKVILRGGTFRKGFVTEHKIATIKLKANKTGNSSVSASDVILLAGDGAGTPVTVTESVDNYVNLYVYDQNSEPGSIGVNVSVSIVTDINRDGKVSLQDISIFMSAWGTKSQIFDFNNDGKMTFKDFSIILSDFFTR
ncbi:MAG: hypothetical protein LR008_00880 [Candidatus Pacebacteria bacterium]|nr:hypothetical protein [Candidatus Paceibacterota bacterium]